MSLLVTGGQPGSSQGTSLGRHKGSFTQHINSWLPRWPSQLCATVPALLLHAALSADGCILASASHNNLVKVCGASSLRCGTEFQVIASCYTVHYCTVLHCTLLH